LNFFSTQQKQTTKAKLLKFKRKKQSNKTSLV
jgi:hypothetical protein